MIRTEYVHNTHYENLPQPDETPHFENLSLDIYRILWYTKIVIDSMHTFLLGGVGCLAYVRRDPPVYVVRFIRYVTLIKSGDDIKTVQENLGHATAAFTLDVYGHVTKQMKQDSAARMEQFIKSVSDA